MNSAPSLAYIARKVLYIVAFLCGLPFDSMTASGQGKYKFEDCYTSWEKRAMAPIVPVMLRIGKNTSAYQRSDLMVPEPIPIHLASFDGDELWVRCLGECSRFALAGQVQTEWAFIDDGTEEDPGVFIRGDGSYEHTIENSESVLYLPPRDLEPGGFRIVRILVRLTDATVGGMSSPPDLETRVTLRVTIERSPQAGMPQNSPTYYSVSAEFESLHTPEVEDPCEDLVSGCCIFMGGGTGPMGVIEGVFMPENYPKDGMLTHEMRTIRISAFDLDVTNWECGEAPDCPSVHPTLPPVHHDKLRYVWSVEEGDGEIVQSHQSSASVTFEAGGNAGRVRLRVTIFNPSSGFLSYTDDPLQVDVEFQVYDFTWIDQSNSALARLLPQDNPAYADTWRKVGLSVSTASLKVVPPSTNASNLTGCGGGSDHELFHGNYYGAPPDPNTYRLQIDAAESDPENEYRVQVRTRRAVEQGGIWGAEEPYDEIVETVTVGGNIHRLRQDLRLVSNEDPGHGHPGVYDDEICGNQTVLVKLGDWIDAELQVKPDGEDWRPVSSIEVPVERPWTELPPQGPGWPQNGPRSILSFAMRFTYSEASPSYGNATEVELINGTWPEAVERMAAQVSEDFAQTGMICTATSRGGRPLVNSLFVRQPTMLHPVQAGTLELELHWAGAIEVIPIAITADSFSQGVAMQIVDEIQVFVDPQGLGDPIVDYWRYAGRVGHLNVPEGHFVFVARGLQDVRVEVLQVPVNLSVSRFVPTYPVDPGEISSFEVAEFAANNRLDIPGAHGLPQDNDEVDIMIMRATQIWDIDSTGHVPRQGWAYHWGSLDPSDARWQAIAVTADAGDGNDLQMPLILGHEVGHYLLAQSGHSTAHTNLMYDDLEVEMPDGAKRLNTVDGVQPKPNQIRTVRNDLVIPLPARMMIPEQHR